MALVLSASTGADENDVWEPVRKILASYPLKQVAFSAGDAAGRRFTFEKGSMKMNSHLMMASSSKFPAALAVVGAVAAGNITFETYAHEVFLWWDSDPKDPRSRVTLRHLLSFTSGFWAPDAGGEVPCLEQSPAKSYTAEACAKEIYEQAPFAYEPGSTWAYNSFHLQIAGAMAAKASHMSVKQLLEQNLIRRLHLEDTMWTGGENPQLAGNMITTGDDYDKILRAYLGYHLVPKAIADEMERDYLEPPVQVANSSRQLPILLGHYSMCNYFECAPPKLGAFTEACRKANIHVDAGLFGYYPMVDRAQSTYMQVVLFKVPTSKLDFYLPTIASMVLRDLVKPFVDCALREVDVNRCRSLARSNAGEYSDAKVVDLLAEALKRAGLAGRFSSPAEFWEAVDALEAPVGNGATTFVV